MLVQMLIGVARDQAPGCLIECAIPVPFKQVTFGEGFDQFADFEVNALRN